MESYFWIMGICWWPSPVQCCPFVNTFPCVMSHYLWSCLRMNVFHGSVVSVLIETVPLPLVFSEISLSLFARLKTFCFYLQKVSSSKTRHVPFLINVFVLVIPRNSLYVYLFDNLLLHVTPRYPYPVLSVRPRRVFPRVTEWPLEMECPVTTGWHKSFLANPMKDLILLRIRETNFNTE